MVELSRADLALLSIVFLMMLVGAGALLIGALRRRAAAGTLVLFGLFSLLHGMRVAVSLPIAKAILGVSPHALDIIRNDLTYVVLLPLMLLVERFVGRGWRGTMRATLRLQVAYSTIGVAADLITGRPGVVMAAKPYAVLVIGAVALGNVLYVARQTRDMPRALVIGFLAFLATVGVYNFNQIIHGQLSQQVETVGFIILVGCLAYAVVVHAFDTEASLRSLEREIRTAQRIQASILPQELPAIPGVTIAARYRPMATMAGDFYDFLPVDDGRLGVLVADVMGHGLPASLIASMVKVALHAEASHADDPGAVMSGVNATLVGMLGRERDYVTASYLVVTPAAGEIRYSIAGHPPPLLGSRDGRVSALDGGGTILGKFAGPCYDTLTRRVDPGSRLLIYTDGVTEAVSPSGEFFGEDRLKAFLAERREAPADTFADALIETLAAWHGVDTLDDDVTVVVLDI